MPNVAKAAKKSTPKPTTRYVGRALRAAGVE
jgi:hypothetical protein